MLLLTLLVLAAPPKAAPVLKLEQTVQLKCTRCEARFLDGGRFVAAGSDWRAPYPHKDHRSAVWETQVYDLEGKAARTVVVPLAPLFDAEKELFIDGSALHRVSATHAVRAISPTLVAYRDGRAFALVENRVHEGRAKRARWVWAVFDGEQLVASRVLAEVADDGSGRRAALEVKAVQPLPGDEFLLLLSSHSGTEPEIKLSVELRRIALDTGETVWSRTLELPPSNNANRSGFSVGFSKNYDVIALGDYSEEAGEPLVPRPQLHVVWTKADRVLHLDAPYTPYGIVINEAGTLMAVAGNQNEKLYRYDLTGGKKTGEFPMGKHTHRLLLTSDEKRLVVLSAKREADVRPWPALAPAKKLTASSVTKQQTFCARDATLSHDRRRLVLPSCSQHGFTDDTGFVSVSIE